MNHRSGPQNTPGTTARHNLSRRRTLMHKSNLLRYYGFGALVGSCGAFLIYMGNKRMNPPEYATQELQERSENRNFSVMNVLTRFRGAIYALRDRNVNRKDQDQLYLPRSKKD